MSSFQLDHIFVQREVYCGVRLHNGRPFAVFLRSENGLKSPFLYCDIWLIKQRVKYLNRCECLDYMIRDNERALIELADLIGALAMHLRDFNLSDSGTHAALYGTAGIYARTDPPAYIYSVSDGGAAEG